MARWMCPTNSSSSRANEGLVVGGILGRPQHARGYSDVCATSATPNVLRHLLNTQNTGKIQ